MTVTREYRKVRRLAICQKIARKTYCPRNSKRVFSFSFGTLMFGIGLPEMLVILAVALLVVGPDKLPGLARSVARTLLELKKTAEGMKNEFMTENPLSDLKTLKTDLLDFKPDLQEAAKRFQEQILDIEDKEIKAAPGNTATESTATGNMATESTATENTAVGMPENQTADKAAAAGNAEVPPVENQPAAPTVQP